MLIKVRGIVLHHIKYKESSAIVHMYTDLHGRQSYIINNVRGKKGQHRANMLQPLFFLEMEVYHKPVQGTTPHKRIQSIYSFPDSSFRSE